MDLSHVLEGKLSGVSSRKEVRSALDMVGLRREDRVKVGFHGAKTKWQLYIRNVGSNEEGNVER